MGIPIVWLKALPKMLLKGAKNVIGSEETIQPQVENFGRFSPRKSRGLSEEPPARAPCFAIFDWFLIQSAKLNPENVEMPPSKTSCALCCKNKRKCNHNAANIQRKSDDNTIESQHDLVIRKGNLKPTPKCNRMLRSTPSHPTIDLGTINIR